jgi:hypothetical protein
MIIYIFIFRDIEEEREREKQEAETSIQQLLLENQIIQEKYLAIEEKDILFEQDSELQQELLNQQVESNLALETLKVTMKTDFDALMVTALNDARQQHRADMKEYRHRIADRCRTLITKQRTHFALERYIYSFIRIFIYVNMDIDICKYGYLYM